MGRQILLSMMPNDVEELLTHIKSRRPVIVLKRDDPNSATVEPMTSLPLNGTQEETDFRCNGGRLLSRG
jgi:hypothetical protein